MVFLMNVNAQPYKTSSNVNFATELLSVSQLLDLL